MFKKNIELVLLYPDGKYKSKFFSTRREAHRAVYLERGSAVDFIIERVGNENTSN